MNTDGIKNIKKVLYHLKSDYNLTEDILFRGMSSKNISSRSSVLDILQLTENLHVNEQDLFLGVADIDLIAKNLNTEYFKAKPFYSKQGAFSKIASLNSFFSGLDKNCKSRNHVLKKLQIHPDYLKNPENPISILDVSKAINLIGPFLSPKHLWEIGQTNAIKFLAGPLKTIVESEDYLQNKIESFFHHTGLIEKNWEYEIINSNHKEILIQSTEKESFQDETRCKRFTTSSLNIWRWSFLSHILNKDQTDFIECEQINGEHDRPIVSIKKMVRH